MKIDCKMNETAQPTSGAGEQFKIGFVEASDLRGTGNISNNGSVIDAGASYVPHELAGLTLRLFDFAGRPRGEFIIADNRDAPPPIEGEGSGGAFGTEIFLVDDPNADDNPANDIDFRMYSYEIRQTQTWLSSGCDYQFANLQLDPATGLHFAKARWYDAVTGRFLSRDRPPRDRTVRLRGQREGRRKRRRSDDGGARYLGLLEGHVPSRCAHRGILRARPSRYRSRPGAVTMSESPCQH